MIPTIIVHVVKNSSPMNLVCRSTIVNRTFTTIARPARGISYLRATLNLYVNITVNLFVPCLLISRFYSISTLLSIVQRMSFALSEAVV